MSETKPKRERARTPNNATTTGFSISDELWGVMQPLLPVHENTHRFGGGRPRVPDRRCADGILYVLRTGCQWMGLIGTTGSWSAPRWKIWPSSAQSQPMKTPQGMFLDKGYDYEAVRSLLKEFGFTAHIRSRGEEAREVADEAGKRARRWVVERSHGWMNRFRRILVRWDKKPERYLAFLHFACALIAFRAAGLFG